MTLKKWLEIKGMNPTDFWNKYKKTFANAPCKSSIYFWANGDKKPRDNRIKQIHQMTGGAVTRNDWK